MRVCSCTTVPFAANDGFWIRDTGLICRELRKLGYDSFNIMPEPYSEEDQRGFLLRVPMRDLESAAWWKSQHIDVVFLYSWAAPRYIKVARAIRQAGIYLIMHLDMADYLPVYWNRSVSSLAARISLFVRRAGIDLWRAKHMRYAHVLTTSKPVREMLAKRCFYGASIANRVREFPAYVSSAFQYEGQQKQPIVVTCANWGAGKGVKRPWYLMACVDCLVADERFDASRIEIYGPPTDEMLLWYQGLSEKAKQQVVLAGRIANDLLPAIDNRSQVSLCFSSSESTHIASLEALCSGCSVVVSNRYQLNVVQDYTHDGCGRVSEQDTPESMAEAIIQELAAWQRGERDAHRISTKFLEQCGTHYTLPRLLKDI